MKKIFSLFVFLSSLFINLFAQSTNPVPVKTVIDDALRFSTEQSIRMAQSLHDRPGMLPKTTNHVDSLITCTPQWWTSGFFPGTLWYLYEYSGNDTVKEFAKEFTMRVANQQYTTDNHDVGFIINCSFGNGYRITGDTSYRSVLHNASRSLLTRFNPALGLIRSWNTNKNNTQWQYAVIIDNMMNLELLLKTAKEFNEPTFSSQQYRMQTKRSRIISEMITAVFMSSVMIPLQENRRSNKLRRDIVTIPRGDEVRHGDCTDLQ